MTREQKLVDIVFEVAIVSAKYMNGKPNDEIAAWVAHQLKECGFDTKPCGMSWGVLLK